MDGEDKGFLGKTKELEAVLGFKTERLHVTYKTNFDTFREKLAEYAMKTFTSARQVVPFIKYMINPMTNFRKENKPKVKRKKDESAETAEKRVKTEGDTKAIVVSEEDEDEDMYFDPDDYVEKMMLDTKIKSSGAQEEQLKNNVNKVYAIVNK